MFKVSLYLDTRRISKRNNNGYPVKLVLYDSIQKKQKQLSTSLYQTGRKLTLTPELSQKFQVYQDRVSYCNQLKLPFNEAVGIIKEGFKGETCKEIELLRQRLEFLQNQQQIDFECFVNELIKEKELAGKSVRHFKEAIAQMNHFVGDKRLYINDITYAFLMRFETFKRTNGCGRGYGIHKTIRTLRTIYNEAKRRGLIQTVGNNPFEGLEIKIQPKLKREVWTIDDLRSLFSFIPKQSTSDVNKYNMNRALDIFLFQIAIGGHDLADVANLKWSNIEDDRIHFQRFKLRSHSSRLWINNMLLPFAKTVIEKYGDKRNERIFSFLAAPNTEKYRKQNGYQLRTLRRISDTLGILPIKTKSPRYIFRTLGGMLAVNELLLMQIMGHKPSNISFRYQHNLSLEKQDKVHQQILEFLIRREVESKC